jgi:outer membrane biosynthesis protein TonB
MTPADRRITELIDKWLASIDLHLKYVELSDAAYARVQAWPKHDRPTRWVLEVARQKILELKAQCETRQAMGDGKFSEALELMSFLANLVGIQHIQRFVPLADPSRTEPVVSSTTATVEVAQPPRAAAPAQKPRPSGDDTTREMPRIKATAPPPPRPAPTPARAAPAPARAAPPPAPAPAPAKRTDGAKAPARAAVAAPPRPAAAAAAKSTTVSAELRGKIIADGIRLLKWGKSWHELPELIERIAERPSATEIRKVLRANRADIEAKASE